MNFKYNGKFFSMIGVSENDHIYKSIKNNKCFYEQDLLDYLKCFHDIFIEQNTISIDVGGNIGNHSTFFGAFLTKDLIVIEPNKKVLPILKENLSKNISNFSIYECGAGEKISKANISIPMNANNNEGMARVTSDEEGDEIDILTLDSIYIDWKKKYNLDYRVSIIKVDVEGMELEVLKGATSIIKEFKPEIFLEAFDRNEFKKLYSFLKPHGYNKLSRWAATPVYHFSYKPTLKKILYSKYKELVKNLKKMKLRNINSFRKRLKKLGLSD